MEKPIEAPEGRRVVHAGRRRPSGAGIVFCLRSPG